MYKKNKQRKRIISTLILTIYILFGILNLFTYAENNNYEKENLKNTLSLNNIEAYVKTYNDSEFVRSKSTKDLTQDIVSEIYLPSNYEYGKDDRIKINKRYQEELGLCWAFSSINVIETSAQKQLGVSSNEVLSRRYLDYISSNTIKGNLYKTGRPLGYGSELQMGIAYGVNGSGLVYEKDFPMHYENKQLSLNDLKLPKAPYNVKDFKVFDKITKKYRNGKIRYYLNNEDVRELHSTEIEKIRKKIKKHVMTKGAVATKIFVKEGRTGKEFYSGTGKHLFIHPENPVTVNHAVTIVGWDDNISKELFRDPISKKTPENNGAWIIEDTRGGLPRGLQRDDTRYYVSYDSVNVESSYLIGVESMRRVNNSTEKTYTDYSWGPNAGIGISGQNGSEIKSVELVKVFEKTEDTLERIKGVGIYTSEPVDVEVAVIPVLRFQGKQIDALSRDNTSYINKKFSLLNDGYSYLDISDIENNKITAKNGEKFAIKLKYISQSNGVLIGVDVKRPLNAGPEITKISMEKEFKPDTSYLRINNSDNVYGNNEGFLSLYGTEGSELRIDNLSREKKLPINVYAESAEQFDVSFDLNGGIGNAPSQKVGKYQKAQRPSDPVKKGYIFKGWTPDINEKIIRNTTFKAIWEKDNTQIQYRVSFDLKGGNIDGNRDINPIQVKAGEIVKTIKDPTKEGYTFIGWFPDIKKPINSNTTFQALWSKNPDEKIKHRVSFDLQGGIGNYGSFDVEDGTILQKPKDPSRSEYIFSHWEPDITKPIRKDTEFKAIWLPKDVGFTLKYNIESKSDLIKVIPYGKKPSEYLNDLEKNPKKEGYIFLGWEPSLDEPLLDKYTVFEAKWKKEPKGEALISFYSDRGRLYKQKSIKIDEKVTKEFLEEVGEPTKDKYEFIGWNYDFSKAITEDVNIFAKWTEELEDEVKIDFDLNGGYFFLNSTLTYSKKRNESFSDWLDKMLEITGQSINQKVPSKKGYTFVCWVDKSTNIRYPNTKELKNKYELKAVWTDEDKYKNIEDIINDAYKKFDAKDEDSKIEDINQFILNKNNSENNNNEGNTIPGENQTNNGNNNNPNQNNYNNNNYENRNENNNQNRDINRNTNTNINVNNQQYGREREKSYSRPMTFYEPMGRENRKETNSLEINNPNRENEREKLNIKPETGNPKAGLQSNFKVYMGMILLTIISIYYGFKIFRINKTNKRKNIY